LERTDALGQEAQDLVRDLVTQGDAHARVALAQAIEHQESFKAPFEQVLTNLACHPEPAVMASAARAMAVFPRASFIHPLIAMLTFREPRNPARSALAAIGKDCVDALTGALVDDSVDFGIRVNVPHTLSVWPNEEVAERLAGHLLAEESGMIRLKILRALWRMRQINPSLTLNLNALRDSMERAIESAYVALDWVWTLKEGGEEVEGRRTVGHELLTTLIQDKYEHALDRVFRHLDLIYEDEDFARIHRGLKSTDRGHVASSLELLENLLSSPLREAVLGLVEPTSPSEDRRERLKHRFPRYTPIQETYEELLARILDSDSDSLRAVTAYHVGELKLPNFKHQLESLDFDDGSSAKEVVEHALAKLGEGAEGGAA
jgi:HEAT repeat protein